MTDSSSSTPPALRPIWEFIIHVFVGAIIFSTLALIAVGMNFVRTYFQFESFISTAFNAIELTILVIDALLFTLFLFRTSVVFLRRTFSELRDREGSSWH